MGAYCRTQSKWMEQCKRNTNWKKEINHIHKLRTNNENIWKLNKSLSLLRDFTKSYSLKKLNLSLHRLKWGHKLLTKINGNDVIKNYLWKNSNSLSVNWTRKKSPSDDGLTGTFQRLFQDHITDLLNVLKEATEACRFLSPMCRGLITPEPDKNQMIQNDNWRPVTQINNDVKLLSYIFTERLQFCLDAIIVEC